MLGSTDPAAARTAPSVSTARHRLVGALALAAATTAPAQTGPAPDAADRAVVDTIVVTGSRVETTALKSLAPIEVVGGQALRDSGASDLRTALSAVSPSYIQINSNGGGLAKSTGGSSLRGLSGNHVLVLVNGRRRHGSSMINNRGGVSLGSSAPDIGHIPVAAVDHVEILTDGAAAQYGSDAIAGVINVILKSNATGGSAEVSYGEYDHSAAKLGGVGDAAATKTLKLNQGFTLGEEGFLTLSAGVLDIGESSAVGPWKQPTRAIWQLYGAAGDPREAAASRWVHSSTEVSPTQKLGNAAYNLELPLGKGVNLYSFGTYSARDARAKGSYRSETNGTANVVTTPGGYGPRMKTLEHDWQVDVGATGPDLWGWAWDTGVSYGRNRSDVSILNTTNASFGPTVPLQDMKWGDLDFTETLLNLTLKRAFATGAFADPLRVTVGAEYRRNQLQLGAGDYLSYASGGYRFPADYPAANLRGTLAGAGSAFSTGVSPDLAFDRSRNNKAFFADFSQQITPQWEAALAGRYERYSDFGSAASGKLSSRYAVSNALAVRGTVSNGFRAPSLAEQYYASAQVQPVNDPITGTSYVSYDWDTMLPTSPAAAALGASTLRAEKSNNLSVGFVLTPTENLSASLDVYQIDIKDRIYLTGSFNGFNNPAVANILRGAGLSADQTIKYFTNFGDTRTQGLEAKVDYAAHYGSWGRARWGLAYAHNRQKVTKINTPAVLAAAGQSLLGRDRVVLLEDGLPQHIVRGTVSWRIGQLQVDVTESWYSQTRTVNNVLNAGQDSLTPAAFITDAALTWHFSKQLRATLGARNLFNRKAPNSPDSYASSVNYQNPNPVANTPWGIGGGFYYARLGYQW